MPTTIGSPKLFLVVIYMHLQEKKKGTWFNYRAGLTSCHRELLPNEELTHHDHWLFGNQFLLQNPKQGLEQKPICSQSWRTILGIDNIPKKKKIWIEILKEVINIEQEPVVQNLCQGWTCPQADPNKRNVRILTSIKGIRSLHAWPSF